MADENAKVPHCMLPNFTSILPEYANAEQDKIREVRSFPAVVPATIIA